MKEKWEGKLEFTMAPINYIELQYIRYIKKLVDLAHLGTN